MKRARHILLDTRGVTMVEVLISGVLLAASLMYFAISQKDAFRVTAGRHKGEDLQNLLEQRLARVSSVIRDQGIPDFLRQYATATGDLSVFNPVMDKDPLTSFNAAFQIPTAENVTVNAIPMAVTYSMKLKKATFDAATGAFVETDLAIGTDPLNQVSSIWVQAQGTAVNPGSRSVNRLKEVVIAF